MKLYSILTLFLLLTMLFVPLFSLLGSENDKVYSNGINISETAEKENSKTQKEDKAEDDNGSNNGDDTPSIAVKRVSSGKVEQVDLFDYVVCATAGEMPPSYEKEAIKAQAVAVYSYALYLKNNPVSDDNDLTDDPSVHQAYSSREELKKKWGESYEKNISKIEEAVKEVYGEYLTYDGKLIKPAFFALSNGRTNSAKDVWGNDVPYFQSVTSDYDKLSASFTSSFEFEESELCQLLSKISDGKIKEISIDECVTTASGYVKNIEISGERFTGEKIRSALSLRSGSFTVEQNGDTYKFICSGYGHGVGMSQYGANGMAKNGSSYEEILKHYYSGIEIGASGSAA